jgi:Inner membrane protein YgaP-like, transmembrane domain
MRNPYHVDPPPIQETQPMSIERMIRVIAGSFILVSLGLGVPASPFFVSSYWLWFTAFVGANLLQSGFTRFCLMEVILRKLGVAQPA